MKSFLKNLKGVSPVSAIMVAIALILVAVLMPIALSEIANATTTNWNASVITIFQVLLPIIGIIGIAISFIPRVRGD